MIPAMCHFQGSLKSLPATLDIGRAYTYSFIIHTKTIPVNFLYRLVPMTNQTEQIRWGAERRLEFIEFQAFWEGGINRSDITNRFGVSVPQASNDISLYQRLAPENLEYDSSAKRYVPTSSFRPRFLRPNPERYLAQLRGIADGIIEQEETWIAEPPTIDAMSIPTRKVGADALRGLVRAIRHQQSVEVSYQSMNPLHPEPIWRRITPHAFGFDGVRWHVRAFCHLDDKFKDFVLSRCYAVKDFSLPGSVAADDNRWHTFFTVVLEPNPLLSPAQKKAIAMDFSMEEERLSLSVRQALLFYFNKRMRLDMLKYDKDPAQNPIVVVNKAEYEKALQESNKPSG